MYNIKNKIYVQHLDKFAPYEGTFILLDNGKYADVFFGEEVGMVFRHNTFNDMIENEYGNDINVFWDFLNSIDKLIIYTELETDYIQLFVYAFIELMAEFGVTNPQNSDQILELYEISEFLQENRDISYRTKFDELKLIYTPSSGLYDSTQIEDVPLEGVVVLNDTGYLTDSQANIKLATIGKPMLEEYVASMLKHVKNLITRDVTILQTFLADNTILTLTDIKAAIVADPFLTKLLSQEIIDIDLDFTSIESLYNIAFASEQLTDDDHTVEFSRFIDLYQNPNIVNFKLWIKDLLNFNFFSSRYLKFNDFILESFQL